MCRRSALQVEWRLMGRDPLLCLDQRQKPRSSPHGWPRGHILCSSYPARKIQSLVYKNMKFTQTNSPYSLPRGRLMVVSLRETHLYGKPYHRNSRAQAVRTPSVQERSKLHKFCIQMIIQSFLNIHLVITMQIINHVTHKIIKNGNIFESKKKQENPTGEMLANVSKPILKHSKIK